MLLFQVSFKRGLVKKKSFGPHFSSWNQPISPNKHEIFPSRSNNWSKEGILYANKNRNFKPRKKSGFYKKNRSFMFACSTAQFYSNYFPLLEQVDVMMINVGEPQTGCFGWHGNPPLYCSTHHHWRMAFWATLHGWKIYNFVSTMLLYFKLSWSHLGNRRRPSSLASSGCYLPPVPSYGSRIRSRRLRSPCAAWQPAKLGWGRLRPGHWWKLWEEDFSLGKQLQAMALLMGMKLKAMAF